MRLVIPRIVHVVPDALKIAPTLNTNKVFAPQFVLELVVDTILATQNVIMLVERDKVRDQVLAQHAHVDIF